MDKDKHRALAVQINAESSCAAKQTEVGVFSNSMDVHTSSVCEGVEAIFDSDLDGAGVHSFGPEARDTSNILFSVQIVTYRAT